jgi:hypothetical protein
MQGNLMIKVQLVDIEDKKEAQVRRDMSLTPEERFKRMFDLIEFCAVFSKVPKPILVDHSLQVFVLRKRVE